MVDLIVDVGEGGAPSLESQQNQAIASIKFRQSSMLETIGICLVTFDCEKTLRNPSDRFFFLFLRHPPSMLSTEMHEGEIKYFAGQKGWAPVVFVVVDWKSKNS